MLEDWEIYEEIHGIPTKYKNKKTGRIISAMEYELLRIKELFGVGVENE